MRYLLTLISFLTLTTFANAAVGPLTFDKCWTKEAHAEFVIANNPSVNIVYNKDGTVVYKSKDYDSYLEVTFDFQTGCGVIGWELSVEEFTAKYGQNV